MPNAQPAGGEEIRKILYMVEAAGVEPASETARREENYVRFRLK